jgi:hypothetical protein
MNTSVGSIIRLVFTDFKKEASRPIPRVHRAFWPSRFLREQDQPVISSQHQIRISGSQVLEPGVRSDTSHRPKSKLREVPASLRRQWAQSLARIMAEEFRNFPRRIVAILRTSQLGFGPELPLSPWDHSLEKSYPVSNFLLACNEGIQQPKTENPWSGRLEAQMAAQAFQPGAR